MENKVNESLGQLVRPLEQMENMQKMLLEQQKEMLDKIDSAYDKLESMKQSLEFDRLADMVEKLQWDIDLLKQEMNV